MKILVAVDGSPASLMAARTADVLFGPMQPEVVMLSVTEPTTPLVVDPLGLVHQGQDAREHGVASNAAANDALAAAASEIPAAIEIAAEGDPVECICRVAEAEDADVIVVGAEDKGVLLRLIDRPVSTRVLRHTRRPVLVVHAPDGAG